MKLKDTVIVVYKDPVLSHVESYLGIISKFLPDGRVDVYLPHMAKMETYNIKSIFPAPNLQMSRWKWISFRCNKFHFTFCKSEYSLHPPRYFINFGIRDSSGYRSLAIKRINNEDIIN
jgi:hypothetical protein